MQAVVTILGIERKDGQGQKGPWTLFKVKASDGNEYATFDAATAQQANALIGSAAHIDYDAEPSKDGKYTNLKLKGVQSANGVAVQDSLVAVAPAAVGTPTAQVGVEPSTFQQEKDARITRLSAASTAFQYAAEASLEVDDALELASRIEEFANHGALGPVNTPQPVAAGAPAMPWDDAA